MKRKHSPERVYAYDTPKKPNRRIHFVSPHHHSAKKPKITWRMEETKASSTKRTKDKKLATRLGKAWNVANWYGAGKEVGGLAGLVAGGPAGMATGEVVGGATGALVGAYRNGLFDRTKIKKMPKGYIRTGNVGVQRSIMNIKGKPAHKAREKHVHVSKHLRAAIKQVATGITAHGSYRRIFSGVIGNSIGSSSAPGVITGDGFSVGMAAFYSPGSNQPVGSGTFFNQLMRAPILNAAITAVAATIVPGSDLNFFTPGKILHAASVCWNQKVESLNPYGTTQNLSTLAAPLTGASIVTAPGSLKIDVKKSWVKFTLKNLSVRVMYIDIWELGPKLKFESLNPLQSLYYTTSQNDDNTNAINKEVAYYTTASGVIPVTTTQSATANMWMDKTVDPVAEYKNRGFNFTGCRREMVLQPGETCTHIVKGPSGVLDFQKLQVDGTNVNQTALLKNWSTSCMIRCRGDQVARIGTTSVNYGTCDTFFDSAVANSLSDLVALEFVEQYEMAVPEIAGYMNTIAFPTGVTAQWPVQELNLRKKKTVVSNFLPAAIPTQASGVLSTSQIILSNAENPAALVQATDLE
nr:MAG: capsid protein [Cressdnaviricota sp.]